MKYIPALTASALVAFTLSANAATIHTQEEKATQPDIQVGEICHIDRKDMKGTARDIDFCRKYARESAQWGTTTNIKIYNDGFLTEEFTCRPGEKTVPDFLQTLGIKDTTYHPVCE